MLRQRPVSTVDALAIATQNSASPRRRPEKGRAPPRHQSQNVPTGEGETAKAATSVSPARWTYQPSDDTGGHAHYMAPNGGAAGRSRLISACTFTVGRSGLRAADGRPSDPPVSASWFLPSVRVQEFVERCLQGDLEIVSRPSSSSAGAGG
jgi:hypothetical protein